MILAALNSYYHRMRRDDVQGLPPLGYERQQISYSLLLTPDGGIVDVSDLRDVDERPQSLIVPQLAGTKTSAVRSNFLWENSSYVFGVSCTRKRTDREHEEFCSLHKKWLSGEADPDIKAFLYFLDAWTPGRFKSAPFSEKMLDANFVFRIDGRRQYLHENPVARAANERKRREEASSAYSICLVTGEESPIALVHPRIKGVYDSQSSGASIVSFNLDAFSSYGKKKGENAPISEDATSAYTAALNYLLRRETSNRQCLRIGDATVVFWAQADSSGRAQAAEDLLAGLFNTPSDDAQEVGKVRTALEAVRRGRPLRELDANLDEKTHIFVLGLAPNASRLSIRFWHTDTLDAFARRLASHFDDLRLEPLPWRTPPALWRLLLETVPSRDGKLKSEDILPQLAGELTRAILTGARYPRSLLSNVIMRMRADRMVSGLRAALCKAVLTRDRRTGVSGINEDLPVSLDTTNTNAGYLLGRLFSVLEDVQRFAHDKALNTTIRDRYYGAASATPASVFPILLRNTQHHLSRIRKDKAGFARNLEREIGEIMALLDVSFPRSLRIEAQGHFAIGYYHESQSRISRWEKQDTDQTDDQEGEEP